MTNPATFVRTGATDRPPAIIHDALAITGKDAVCVITGMGPFGESRVPID
jgi:hypothetical protein